MTVRKGGNLGVFKTHTETGVVTGTKALGVVTITGPRGDLAEIVADGTKSMLQSVLDSALCDEIRNLTLSELQLDPETEELVYPSNERGLAHVPAAGAIIKVVMGMHIECVEV